MNNVADTKTDISHSLKVGLSFGLTSGVITTLGLMTGLYASTHSKPVVIGGILTIAIADACSDALGIHISEESENVHTHKEVWVATLSTFVSKFLCALSFVVPCLFLPIETAAIVSMVWGGLVLGVFSYYIGVQQKSNPLKIVAEHLFLAAAVIVITYFVGNWIGALFG